ncbi:MAG: DUF2723 domain-containing protein [Acidobacteria bacterium]|nr:DUF2723 domain-containing protein [Acidobacteriota bacterium]
MAHPTCARELHASPRRVPWEHRVEWLVLLLAVAALLALRLPFLPPTLDDVDSVNFDLGVHKYDPVHHQPHPPGYPVYIFLARLIHPWFQSHAAGLAVVSALFSALSGVPLYWLMRRLTSRPGAVLACVLTLFNPVFWFNSVRPMSDLSGFFFVTAAQCLLVTALLDDGALRRSRVLWLAGAAIAGLGVGVRAQTLWLVGPLLLYGAWHRRSARAAAATGLCFAAAVALWLVPMLVLSGGMAPFLDSFSTMMRSALPAEPLVTDFSIRRAVRAAVDVWLAPWQAIGFGAIVLVLAATGTAILARTDRRLLGLLLLLFLPYGLYHYAAQATQHLRYAIPTLPLVAFLATVPLLRSARRVQFLLPAAAVGAIVVAAMTTMPALAAYHATPSPPFQALAALERLDAASGSVVTGHYVFERYLPMVRKHQVLMPAQGAWQTLMTYWQQRDPKPILFLNQRGRTTLLAFGHPRRERLGRWRWPDPVRPFMRGERPGWVELLRLDAPNWFSESGLLVTAEAGPLEKVLNEQPRLRVRASRRRSAFVVSGFLRDAVTADVSLTVRDRRQSKWRVGQHFTARTLLDPLPGAAGYLPASLGTTAPAVFTDVWLAPEDSAFIRPSHGFYVAERDDDSELFRWIAPVAVATAYLPAPRGRLTIEGWIPAEYYELPLVLSMEWNGRPLASVDVHTPRFRIERELPGSSGAPWGELKIRSSHSFVPDEQQHNGDRRVLAARIYRLTLD